MTAKCKIPICPLDRVTLPALPVWNIPKFKDRTNWSRDTLQAMRRCTCVYQNTNQNIAPVIKNFHNSGRSWTISHRFEALRHIFKTFHEAYTIFLSGQRASTLHNGTLYKDVAHPKWPIAGSFSRLLQTLSH